MSPEASGFSPHLLKDSSGWGSFCTPRITRGAGVFRVPGDPSEGAQEPQSQTLIPEAWSHLQTTLCPPPHRKRSKPQQRST